MYVSAKLVLEILSLINTEQTVKLLKLCFLNYDFVFFFWNTIQKSYHNLSKTFRYIF